MKKKYIVIPIIAIIGLFVAISLFKILSYRLKVSKIENMLLRYYNFEFVDGLSEGCKKEIEFYETEPPTEYNITKTVNFYLSQLKEVKNGEAASKDIYSNKRLYINDNMYYIQFAYDYSAYTLGDDINVDYALSELEKILIHRGNDWFISMNANEKYDLPYEYYLTYDKNKYEKFNSVQKVLSVNFIDRIDFNDTKYDRKGYRIIIKYVDNNNIEKSHSAWAGYYYKTKLWGASLSGLFYNYKDKAEITLHNHIYDRESEEKLRIENEEVAQAQRSLREYENKLEEEENGYRVETKSVFDGAGLIVRYDYFREKRWKYRFNKERSLKGKDIVETIELNEGKHGFELPYTDEMTIDEAVERFLNDREQVKKALALWNIDLDKIKEEDIIEKINEVTLNY